jgi:hypothetical protein
VTPFIFLKFYLGVVNYKLCIIYLIGNELKVFTIIFQPRSELNLGVDRSGFTLVRFCKENPELDLLVKASWCSPLSPPFLLKKKSNGVTVGLFNHLFILYTLNSLLLHDLNNFFFFSFFFLMGSYFISVFPIEYFVVPLSHHNIFFSLMES